MFVIPGTTSSDSYKGAASASSASGLASQTGEQSSLPFSPAPLESTTSTIRSAVLGAPAGTLPHSSVTSAIAQRSLLGGSAGNVEGLIKEARKHIGKPYVVGGGHPPESFDCSSFAQYVFRTAASIDLPRVSKDQWARGAGKKVSKEDLAEGDLVFFGESEVTHVGICISNTRMISAQSGKTMQVKENGFVGFPPVVGGRRIL